MLSMGYSLDQYNASNVDCCKEDKGFLKRWWQYHIQDDKCEFKVDESSIEWVIASNARRFQGGAQGRQRGPQDHNDAYFQAEWKVREGGRWQKDSEKMQQVYWKTNNYWQGPQDRETSCALHKIRLQSTHWKGKESHLHMQQQQQGIATKFTLVRHGAEKRCLKQPKYAPHGKHLCTLPKVHANTLSNWLHDQNRK